MFVLVLVFKDGGLDTSEKPSQTQEKSECEAQQRNLTLNPRNFPHIDTDVTYKLKSEPQSNSPTPWVCETRELITLSSRTSSTGL